MKLKLIRDLDSGNSTIGRLYCEDEFLCYTLENTWKDNIRRQSCVPLGNYKLSLRNSPTFSPRYGHHLVELVNVPNRDYILIHKGNYPKDTLGCILVGSTKGKDAVWSSSDTYNKIYPIISNSTEIEIVENE